MAVKEFAPKNGGVVKAVLWNGRADCLIGMPMFDEVIVGIKNLDKNGHAEIEFDGREYVAQPNLHYIVLNAYGDLEVWSISMMRQYYNELPTVVEAPKQSGVTYSVNREPL